jgi:hypothetical protein
MPRVSKTHRQPTCGSLEFVMRKKTIDQFVRASKEKHGDFYDYSLADYVNSRTKVTIVCPMHGKFTQTPNTHLRGRGCPKCGIVTTSKKLRKPLGEFIEEASKKYGYLYDYSLVKYVRTHVKVTIVCPLHGKFTQTPANHLGHGGCPKCGIIIRADNRKIYHLDAKIAKWRKIGSDLRNNVQEEDN